MLTNQISQRTAPLIVTAPDRSKSQLLNGRKNRFLQITFTVTVQITATAAQVRNQGSGYALFSNMGVEDNGEDKLVGNGRLWRARSDAMMPSARTATRLTSTAVGTYTLREQIRIPFEHPFAANPRETQFLEASDAALYWFGVYSADVTRLLDLGAAGAAVLSAPSMRVQQYYDGGEAAMPYFTPWTSAPSQDVAQANTALEIMLSAADPVRSLTIQQDSAIVGEVANIINTLILRDDDRVYIGENGPVSWLDLVMAQEFESGGNVYATPNGAYLHINLQEQGRLAKIYTPRQGKNLRLVIDAAPTTTQTAQGGTAGASTVRVLVERLRRERTARPTVSATLPDELAAIV